MEMEAKTSVNIIQDLLALHTEGKEAYSKLKEDANDELSLKLEKGIHQSNDFTEQLLKELSKSGDGVSGEADRADKFYRIWKSYLENVTTSSNQQSNNIYWALEQSVNETYKELVGLPAAAGPSLNEVLYNQFAALNSL